MAEVRISRSFAILSVSSRSGGTRHQRLLATLLTDDAVVEPAGRRGRHAGWDEPRTALWWEL